MKLKKSKNILITLFFITIFVALSCEKEKEIELERIITTNDYVKYAAPSESETGFIFYPGGLVSNKRYGTWLEKLSNLGYNCFSVDMPLQLAFFDIDAAIRIQNKFPEIKNWIVGGHSLGGAMAIELIAKPFAADRFNGLVLLGAYPGENTNISTWQGKALSIYGSKDGVSTIEEVENTFNQLPNGLNIQGVTEFTDSIQSYYHLIEGGNHANFGSYGFQRGDIKAEISRENQQQVVVDFIDAFFRFYNF